MFFTLSKTITALLQPSTVILLIGVAGLALMMLRRPKAGRRLAILSLVLLLICGVLPIGAALAYLLESRFPPWEQTRDPERDAPDGIVVLGGAISPRLSQLYGGTAVNADAGRVLAMGHLARVYPKSRIIYSGGDPSLFGKRRAEADYVGPLLDDFGIPRARVTLEAQSRNTAENAIFSKAIAQPKPGERWLVVTSAHHMPRAIGSFRAAGFDVEAYPVAWRTEQGRPLWPSLAVGRNLSQLDTSVNEWIGLIAYYVTGRSSALLPSP